MIPFEVYFEIFLHLSCVRNSFRWLSADQQSANSGREIQANCVVSSDSLVIVLTSSVNAVLLRTVFIDAEVKRIALHFPSGSVSGRYQQRERLPYRLPCPQRKRLLQASFQFSQAPSQIFVDPVS